MSCPRYPTDEHLRELWGGIRYYYNGYEEALLTMNTGELFRAFLHSRVQAINGGVVKNVVIAGVLLDALTVRNAVVKFSQLNGCVCAFDDDTAEIVRDVHSILNCGWPL